MDIGSFHVGLPQVGLIVVAVLFFGWDSVKSGYERLKAKATTRSVKVSATGPEEAPTLNEAIQMLLVVKHCADHHNIKVGNTITELTTAFINHDFVK